MCNEKYRIYTLLLKHIGDLHTRKYFVSFFLTNNIYKKITHIEKMLICVEYNFSKTGSKNLIFSDDDFLRATGVSWHKATKVTRIDYIRERLNKLTPYDTEFCYVLFKDKETA